MSRYAPPSSVSYSFGPGPITDAVKWIIIANVAMFVITQFFPIVVYYLGLRPQAVFEQGWIWQLGTYLFLHADVMHILLNMLGVWMFGVTLERRWGTHFFAKYYAVTGLGGGLAALLLSLLPFDATAPAFHLLSDRVQVEQGLARMLVRAVSRVDHGDTARGRELGDGAGLGMPHHDHVAVAG